jgi:signal-transduction protein with cAMP-binding, CBS, and nucleotidyltransferase domain
MRFATLGSLITGHRGPSFIAPSASASEAVRQLQQDDVRAMVVMHDAPPVRIVSDRHLVESVIAQRRDPDAMTALELSEPTESFDRATTLDIAWRRVKDKTLTWVAVQEGSRVIALVSRTEMLEWVVRSQEDEVDCAINAVKRLAFSNRRPG